MPRVPTGGGMAVRGASGGGASLGAQIDAERGPSGGGAARSAVGDLGDLRAPPQAALVSGPPSSQVSD